MGTSGQAARTLRTTSRVWVKPPPPCSERSMARWMTGPSATGSKNGTPISSTSAPAFTEATAAATQAATSGSPAVR